MKKPPMKTELHKGLPRGDSPIIHLSENVCKDKLTYLAPLREVSSNR